MYVRDASLIFGKPEAEKEAVEAAKIKGRSSSAASQSKLARLAIGAVANCRKAA